MSGVVRPRKHVIGRKRHATLNKLLYGKAMFVIKKARVTLEQALDEMCRDEWAVSDWRDDFIEGLDSPEAFDSIMPALELALEQSDSYAFDSCCGLALQFAGIAQTTQQPEGLIAILQQLKSHKFKLTQDNRKVNEIAAWFRVTNAI